MLKVTLTTLALTALPGFALAMGCSGYDHTPTEQTAQISCAEGTSWNADTQTCAPIVTG